jgi:hypothetical protein
MRFKGIHAFKSPSRAFMHSKALQGHSCIQKPFKGIHAFKSPSRAFMHSKALVIFL